MSTSGSFHPLALLRMLRCSMPIAALLLSFATFGQSSTSDEQSLHAGWQMGPVALHTERHQSFGVHNLGNTGYGHTLTVQTAFRGPWEFEVQASRAQVIMDDGALRGWKTEIQSGSVMVNWVWDAAGTRKDGYTRSARIGKGFQPFVGVGLAHVDHLMKQDLEDAWGRTYHLWSDGTLRDRDETGDHDGNATVLRRDYTYESDVTGSDFGPTAGRSLAIPAQMGVRLDVSPRIRTRIGIGGWLGLTDQIDGRAGGQWLSGDALASGFFGLAIRLGKLAPKKAIPATLPGISQEDAVLLADMDTDGDGVSNLQDRCPGTRGIAVDEMGCPRDSDGDGYADYRDKEVHSPHWDVDGFGVAKDEAAEDAASPASGWDVIRGKVTSDDPTSYVVHVPKPEEGWTYAERQTLMAFDRLKESTNAVEVLTGPAEERAKQVADKIRSVGLSATVVSPQLSLESTPESASVPQGHHYRVQLGAFRMPNEQALKVLFEGMDIVRFESEDGWTRIVSSSFATRAEAMDYAKSSMSLGFSGSFVLYNHQDAPVTPEAVVAEDGDLDVPQFDADKVTFRVQMAALQTQMDVEALNQLMSMGSIDHHNNMGWHRYLHGAFSTASEARSALPALRAAGFPDAFIVGDVAGSIVPAAEAELLLRNPKP